MSEMNGTVKFSGESIKLGGRDFVVPSLSVKQAKSLWPKIVEINKGVTVENLPEKYDKILEVIHAAISRNYPDVSLEDLNDFVDLNNIRQLQLVVMGQSGLLKGPGPVPVAAENLVE